VWGERSDANIRDALQSVSLTRCSGGGPDEVGCTKAPAKRKGPLGQCAP